MISVDINNGQKLQLVENSNSLMILKIGSQENLVSATKMSYGDFTMLMNAFVNYNNGMDVNLKDYLA